METLICKNCDATAEGNYCSNCGQKKNTVRLDWSYLQEEVKYTFLHINKGLLYTAKQLLKRPGAAVRDFIDGKRVHHYKPVLFLFVTAGLYGLLSHYLGMEELMKQATAGFQKNPYSKTQQEFMSAFYNLMMNHYAIFELSILPIASFCSWLAFRKWGYNYVENIVINSFASGLRLLLYIIAFPLQFLAKDSFAMMLLLNGFLGIFTLGSTIWLYLGLYKGRDLGFVILRIALMAFYFFLFYLAAIIGLVVYLAATGQLVAPAT